MTPVHLIHHIGYDNGDEASPIYQHLIVNYMVGRTINSESNYTHIASLFALQGLGREAKAIQLCLGSADYDCFNVPTWEELLLFTIDNFEDGTFQYNWREADRLHVTNGIIAIPPFITLALTRANSTDPSVLLMAAVEAIRHVLENDVPEEDEVMQEFRLLYLRYISQWLFLASNTIHDDEATNTIHDDEATFGIGVD
jgi:hypothetical protein